MASFKIGKQPVDQVIHPTERIERPSRDELMDKAGKDGKNVTQIAREIGSPDHPVAVGTKTDKSTPENVGLEVPWPKADLERPLHKPMKVK